jgi:O-methyltransferase
MKDATMRHLKNFAKALLSRLGYEVRRVRLSRELIAQHAGRDAVYYANYATRQPVFAPWTGHPDFAAVHAGLGRLSVASPERCYLLVSLACYARHLSGDFAECGVAQGGSALLLCRVLQESPKPLRLFDSFQGLPKPNPIHDRFFREGQYAAPVDVVKERLQDFCHITDFRVGWIPGTFAGLDDAQYAFAHIDVDLYQSTLDSCRYLYPRLTPGGVLLFDEYGFPAAHGEKVAVDEYFADKPERPIALPTGQAMVLKVPPT